MYFGGSKYQFSGQVLDDIVFYLFEKTLIIGGGGGGGGVIVDDFTSLFSFQHCIQFNVYQYQAQLFTFQSLSKNM